MLIRQDRRKFLRNLGLISAGTMVVPAFLQAKTYKAFQSKRLIVIQLSGGNDGLNTVIPFRNDILKKNRPKMSALYKNELMLNDEAILNPVMTGMADLFDRGELSILNSVGYPNPNRSHFRSMDIWQSASDSDEYLSTGWLGRYLDNECDGTSNLTSLELGNQLSLAMKGENYKGIPLSNVGQFYSLTRSGNFTSENHSHGNSETAFLYKTLNDTYRTADYLHEKVRFYRSKADYPNSSFGKDLQQVASLILSGVESPVYYVSQGSYDTHNNQLGRQERLLEQLSKGLEVFSEDLRKSGEWDNTRILIFSEFGRRVKENGSNGTDHGKANNVFLLGGDLKKPGLYNPLPSLQQLDGGDVPYQIDFREVYATLLDKWLETDSKAILGRSWDSLAI